MPRFLFGISCLLLGTILSFTSSCTTPPADPDAQVAAPASQTALSAPDQVAEALPDLEPAKLPPAEKPVQTEVFELAPEAEGIPFSVSLQTPPKAVIEKSSEESGAIWIRAYQDDYFLVGKETDYTWDSLLKEIQEDTKTTYRQILAEYESTALVEVSIEERLHYLVIGLFQGPEGGMYLIRSKPGQKFSKWGAEQMFRSLRLTARQDVRARS